MIMRAKALRPTVITVGNFTEFSMNVTVGVWDEMVNQLLFVLTL